MREFSEREINILESLEVPNYYYKGTTAEYNYWFRSLLQKIDSSIIFSGLPAEWSEDYLKLCLFARGFVGIWHTDIKSISEKYGKELVFSPCNISGFDFYNQPLEAIIQNRYYKTAKPLTVNKDIFLLKITPDFRGLLDIIDHYATDLAELTKGINIGILNAKMPIILSASSESQAAKLHKIYDLIQEGESLICYKSDYDTEEIIPAKEPFESWFQDYTKTYIVDKLLSNMQTILNNFYTEIGIGVTVDKKERLITSEADFSIAQSQARLSCWISNLNEGLQKINSVYGTDIQVIYGTNEEYQEGEEE